MVNQLLARLPGKTRKAVLQRSEIVDLVLGSILCERGEMCREVFFPLSGFLSLVSVISGHPPLETRLIGSEGMYGGMIALGVLNAPQRVVVQGAGSALCMTTEQFCEALQEHVAFSRMIKRYLYVVFEQLAQSAACNRFHEVEPRLARRLLMSHDRAHSDQFHLTHQNLAEILGVLRSAVTIAAGALQQRGLIHYSRGEIRILDRVGLETTACECYATGVAEYCKLTSKI